MKSGKGERRRGFTSRQQKHFGARRRENILLLRRDCCLITHKQETRVSPQLPSVTSIEKIQAVEKNGERHVTAREAIFLLATRITDHGLIPFFAVKCITCIHKALHVPIQERCCTCNEEYVIHYVQSYI